jgi:hypothetical protein
MMMQGENWLKIMGFHGISFENHESMTGWWCQMFRFCSALFGMITTDSLAYFGGFEATD